MKALHALLSALVLIYALEEVTCSAIVLDADVMNEDEVVLKANGGLFDKLITTIMNGYETANQILQDLLDKHDHHGILTGLFDKLKEKLEKLKDYILGGKPAISGDAEEIIRSVERIIEEHRRIHDNSRLILDGAVENVKHAQNAEKLINEGPDLVRHRVYDIDRALRDHIFDVIVVPNESAKNEVGRVEDTGIYKSTGEFLLEHGVRLSDQEKNILDGLLNKARQILLNHANSKHEQLS